MGITAKKQEKRTLLSHEETLDLIDKVQRTGDEQAKEILIEKFENDVKKEVDFLDFF